MSEQPEGLETYSYKGVIPADTDEWGFTIEHQPVEHDVPLREVSPDALDDYKRFTHELSGRLQFLNFGPEQRAAHSRLFPSYKEPGIDEKTLIGDLKDAYEFASWGESVRLYNFSDTNTSDEKLAEAANALRAVGQLTGGSIFDQLSAIVVLPENHPYFFENNAVNRLVHARNADFFKQNNTHHLAGALNGIVFVSEELMAKPSQAKEPTITELPFPEEQTVQYNSFERARHAAAKVILRRETTRQKVVREHRERSAREAEFEKKLRELPYNVGNNNLEDVLVHEFHHILGQSNPEAERQFRPYFSGYSELPPSRYGGKDEKENLAETGRARFLGEGWDALVGPQHKNDYASFLKKSRSGRQGPTHVLCRQLDPRRLKVKDASVG